MVHGEWNEPWLLVVGWRRCLCLKGVVSAQTGTRTRTRTRVSIRADVSSRQINAPLLSLPRSSWVSTEPAESLVHTFFRVVIGWETFDISSQRPSVHCLADLFSQRKTNRDQNPVQMLIVSYSVQCVSRWDWDQVTSQLLTVTICDQLLRWTQV